MDNGSIKRLNTFVMIIARRMDLATLVKHAGIKPKENIERIIQIKRNTFLVVHRRVNNVGKLLG